jgi:hypothetical protein
VGHGSERRTGAWYYTRIIVCIGRIYMKRPRRVAVCSKATLIYLGCRILRRDERQARERMGTYQWSIQQECTLGYYPLRYLAITPSAEDVLVIYREDNSVHFF